MRRAPDGARGKKDRDSSPSGCAQGFGWWKWSNPGGALNDTRNWMRFGFYLPGGVFAAVSDEAVDGRDVIRRWA